LFKSAAGNYYVFGPSTGAGEINQCTAYKASSPQGTYTEQDSSNRPVLTIQGGSMNPKVVDWQREGDVIHFVATRDGSGDICVAYFAFDMSTDAWLQVDGTNTEKLVSDRSWAQTTQASLGFALLDNSDLVIAHGGAEKIMGVGYNRAEYSYLDDSAGTWTIEQALDDGGEQNDEPWAVASDGTACVLLWESAGTTLYGKHLSSTFTLGSATDLTSGTTFFNLYGAHSEPEGGSNGLVGGKATTTVGFNRISIGTTPTKTSETQGSTTSAGVASAPLPDGAGDFIQTWRESGASNNDYHFDIYDPGGDSWAGEVDTNLNDGGLSARAYCSPLVDGTTLILLSNPTYNTTTSGTSNKYTEVYTLAEGSIGKVAGVSWASVGKVGGVSKASIAKVLGVAVP